MRATMLAGVRAAYRRTGADLPFVDDPRAYHGVGMEGYFWRITHAASGTVVVVILAVNRDADGRPWGMVTVAAHPGGFVRAATVEHAWADRRGLRVRAGGGAGPALEADDARLRVDLAPDARLEAAFTARVGWPRRAFGGIGPAQAIPGLSQYWHPYLLRAAVRGEARAGADALVLDGATAYAEKNWGAGGHPPVWWWGQAHGFEREDVCVAFAGGRAAAGPVAVRATALVVALGGEVVQVIRPPLPLRVAVDEQGWRLDGRTPRHAVELEGHSHGTAPHRLPVPVPAERRRMEARSAMHLAGTLRLRLRRRGRTLFEGCSALAGLERGRGPDR